MQSNDSTEVPGVENQMPGPFDGPQWPHLAPRSTYISVAVLMGTVVVCSSFVNGLVLVVSLRYKKLRSPLNYILVNLAVADLMVTFFGSTVSFSNNVNGYFIMGETVCKFEGFMVSLTGKPLQTLSTLCLTGNPSHTLPTLCMTVNPLHTLPILCMTVNPSHTLPTLCMTVNPTHTLPTLCMTVNPLHTLPTLCMTVNPLHTLPILCMTVNPLHTLPILCMTVNPLHTLPTLCMTSIVGLWSLAILAFERYIVICKPMGDFRFQQKHAVIGCSFTWVWSLIWTAPPLFGWCSYVPEGLRTSCGPNWYTGGSNNNSYVLMLFVTCFVMPLSMIIFSYGNLLVTLRAVAAQQKESETTQRAEREVTRMVIAMVMAFLICWLPYTTFALVVAINKDIVIQPTLASMPSYFSKTATVYNPIIYVFMNKQVQEQTSRCPSSTWC
ncbi:OPSP protein, partial [Polyodon spathula]|nr:OPSP protein [Polyodon spathula]